MYLQVDDLKYFLIILNFKRHELRNLHAKTGKQANPG
jgi:hypothetical protein